MIEVQLPPSIAALCKSCETICVQECCGVGAFNFSPFNIIYHLTKWDACIRESDVEKIRSELSEFTKKIQNSSLQSTKITFRELNAIMDKDQALALVEEIGSAVTEACIIYAAYEERIDARYFNYLQIIKIHK